MNSVSVISNPSHNDETMLSQYDLHQLHGTVLIFNWKYCLFRHLFRSQIVQTYHIKETVTIFNKVFMSFNRQISAAVCHYSHVETSHISTRCGIVYTNTTQ